MEIQVVPETEKWTENGKDYKNAFTCTVKAVSITKPNTKITKVRMAYTKSFFEKVSAIKFVLSVVEYFPQGLNLLFPNLIVLEILNSGLKFISRMI